ncbi:MAG: tetratricopeptide repeat protein [Alphaproteobacteria bacterium]
METDRRNIAAWLPRPILPAALAFLLSGCATGDLAGAGEDEAAQSDPPPSLNVVEPVGQRSPYGNFLAGRFAERQRDYDRAAMALNRALEETPDNTGLARRAFYVSLQAGRIDVALSLARRREEAGIHVATAQILLAAHSIKTNDIVAATSRLEAMERSDLARYSVPMALAWALVGAGETDGALEALAPLEKATGFEMLRRLHEGLINDIAGRADAAEAAFRISLGDDPARAPVRMVRAYGGFLERQGRSSEASALYDSRSGRNTDSLLFEEAKARVAAGRPPEPIVAGAADGLAESFFDIASVLPKDRAGEIVLIYVRLALYLNPDFPLAQLLLGEVLDNFERYGEAIEIYRNIDPDSPYGWVARLRLADNLYDTEELEEAVSVLRAMSGQRQDRADALIRLGNILRYEEHFAEAIEAYDEAVRRRGELREGDWTLLYSRGIALERNDQWERAEADFLKALEFEPEQPFVLNYLGYSWVEKGMNLDRAKEMLERAVAQRKDDGYVVDSMGWALYKLGDYDGAVSHLERAVALRSQDPVINDHLGDAYWRVGRTKEARIQWRRVLGLEPEEDLAGTIREKLEAGLPAPGTVENDG